MASRNTINLTKLGRAGAKTLLYAHLTERDTVVNKESAVRAVCVCKAVSFICYMNSVTYKSNTKSVL